MHTNSTPPNRWARLMLITVHLAGLVISLVNWARATFDWQWPKTANEASHVLHLFLAVLKDGLELITRLIV